MKGKAFFASFFVSLIIVLAGFGGLYLLIDRGSQSMDTPQKGVPVAVPGVQDSKTLLLCVGDEVRYFFLFKFDALQNKVGIAAISPRYEISDGNSLEDSLKSAGIMQCVIDIREKAGVDIDYYLQCSWSQLGKITGGLTEFGIDQLGRGLPQGIRNYLLKGAEKLDGQSLANAAKKAEKLLDNRLGLGFMTEAARCTVMYNLDRLPQVCGGVVKDSYSRLVTDLNTTRLKGLDRIFNFLSVSHVEYLCHVIEAGDSLGQEKLAEVAA